MSEWLGWMLYVLGMGLAGLGIAWPFVRYWQELDAQRRADEEESRAFYRWFCQQFPRARRRDQRSEQR